MKDDWIETDIERVRQKDKYGYIDMASGQMERSIKIVIDIYKRKDIHMLSSRQTSKYAYIDIGRQRDRQKQILIVKDRQI